MFTWSHFFVGLIAAALGTLALKFNFQLANLTGRQDWIESKLGSGSTYGVYKILAILIAIGGLIYAVGFGDTVLGWLLSPFGSFFNGFHQG